MYLPLFKLSRFFLIKLAFTKPQKWLFTALFLCGLMNAYSQQKTTNVLFDKDQYTLTPTAKSKLNRIVRDIKSSQNGFQVTLKGHTDDDGSHEYNLTLSRNRTIEVQRYLVKRGIESSFIQLDSFGETKPVLENLNDQNKSANRRVEITVLFEEPKPVVNEVIIPEIPSCNFDTTIEIAGGTQITLSYCDFKKHRNVILRSEMISSATDMLDHGLSLTTNDGQSLITGGMLLLANKDVVFEKPVKIKMPLISSFWDCYDTTVLRQMLLYDANHQGRWNFTDSITPEFINNETYLSFTVQRGGYFNCDALALAPVALIAKGVGALLSPIINLIIKNRTTVRFKSNDGERIKRISLAARCGSCSEYDIISRRRVDFNRKRTKAKVRLTCCMSSDVLVNYQIYGEQDTTKTKLVDLKTRGIAKLGTCGYTDSQNPRTFVRRRGRRLKRKYRLQNEGLSRI